MKEKTISIILPINELDEITKPMFANAIKSIESQTVKPDELVIVVPKQSEVSNFIKEFNYGNMETTITIVENEGETDFSSQVNLGVKNATSEWISILEFDDEYATIWFKNVYEYMDAYQNVGVFMPIVVNTVPDGNFIGFSNEAVWANAFTDELGLLDLNALLGYQGFSIDGLVMQKSIYEEFGGLKPTIKIYFTYEFLLRMTFKDVKVMVIPKFGYKHVNQRPNSLFVGYQETIDPVEAKWWLSQAKKEYYFDKDRKITYTKQTA